jgi:hypothetical protein
LPIDSNESAKNAKRFVERLVEMMGGKVTG